jgi:hypothetical protein
VTSPRWWRRTLIIVTVFAGIAALAVATCVGYYFGRRAGSSPPTWKRRTSRITLGRLAISLLVLLTARRIRRTFRPDQIFAEAVLRLIAPLELLRGSVARMRP